MRLRHRLCVATLLFPALMFARTAAPAAKAASSAPAASGNYPAMGSFLLLAICGVAAGAISGFVIERGVLRPMYGRDQIVMVLVTYAAFLILEDLIKLLWGVDPYFAYQPYALLGRVSIGGIDFATYDFVLLSLAIVTGACIWWGLNRTRRSIGRTNNRLWRSGDTPNSRAASW